MEVDEEVNPPMIPTLGERYDCADASAHNANAAVKAATINAFFILQKV